MTQQETLQNEEIIQEDQGFISAEENNKEGAADLSVCSLEDLTLQSQDIAEVSLENDTLFITMKDGSEIVIQNFNTVMASTGVTELTLADGTVIDLTSLDLENSEEGESEGDQQAALETTETQETEDQAEAVNAPTEETLETAITEGTQDESIAEEVIENIAAIETASGEEAEEVVIAETSEETGEVEVIEIEPAAGEDQNLAQLAQQLAQIETAAGDAGTPGATGRGGFGFDSTTDVVRSSALNAIGPIDPTALQYGVSNQNEELLFLDPLSPPALSVNNGVDSAIVKEDGSIFVPITASLQGGDVADQILTVTISGVDAATALTGGFLPTAVPGVYAITLPAGTNYDGGITVTPDAQSDVDLGQFSVIATASKPSTGEIESVSDDATVITDAVADKPEVDGTDGSTFVNNALDVDIVGGLGVDTDGSETITGYEITSTTDLSGYTFSAGIYNPVTNTLTLDPADLAGLQITPPAGFIGSVDLEVTIFNEETNLSDAEDDASDNTNSASDIFTLTWVKGPEIVYEFSAQVDGDTGLVKEDGSLDLFLNVDAGDPAGPVAGDEVLTVTIEGIDPAWDVTLPGQSGAVWVETSPGTFQITLPAGEDYTGILTFEPPAQSDVDHPQITISATVYDPVLDDSAGDSDAIDIVTDAVADEPEVDGTDGSTFVDQPLDLNIAGNLGDDADGSETITGYEITSATDLSGFTFSAGTYDAVTNTLTLDPSDLAGLQITPPAGFVGSVDLDVTIFNEETNLSDTEVDTTDNTNSATDTFTVTWVDGPVIKYEFSNEVDGDTGLVKEDSSVTLNLEVENVDPVGPVAGDEVLTVTISNLDTTWDIVLPGQSGAVWVETAPGTYQITLPAGESYSGAITFTPPADSDLDHPTFTITADVNDPVLALTESDSATADILTDAVIDTPTLNVVDGTVEEGKTIPLDISAAIGETVDNISETITEITISGLPTGATLNNGTFDPITETWTLTLADLSGLEVTIPDGITGEFDVKVSVTSEEDVEAGDDTNGEVDFSDNVATVMKTLKLTVTKDSIPLIRTTEVEVDESNFGGGNLQQVGSITVDFAEDAPGTVETNGTSPSGLTSAGQDVTIQSDENSYTGKNEDGDTVFTLVLNGDGSYTYTQILPLDHPNAADPDDEIELEFGIVATDSEGDAVDATITVTVKDDGPVANDDVNRFDANLRITDGNVITGDNGALDTTDTDIDVESYDVANTVTNVTFGGVDYPVVEGVETVVNGTYGQLRINSDGSYEYELFDTTPVPGTAAPYEFSNTETFPNLVEGQALTDTDTLGVDPADLDINFDATGTVEFVSEGAGFNNTFGQFYIGNDGSIVSADIIIQNINDVDGSEVVTEFNVDGSSNQGIGFFIIADGFDTNDSFTGLDLENGSLNFIYNFGEADERNARIDDMGGDISLVFTASGGEQTVLQGPVYFTTERGGSENLNADNSIRVVSGLVDETDPTVLRIGFEDLPNLGDQDYEDVVFDVTIRSRGDEKLTDEFEYTLTDFDGDSDTATLTFCAEDLTNVQPIVETTDVTVDETNLEAGNLIISGTLTADFGVDGPGTIKTNGTAPSGLTSAGQLVTIIASASGYEGQNEDGDTVFTFTINSDGTYTYQQNLPLDHPDMTDPDDAIELDFGIVATDADGEEVDATITVTVKDDGLTANDDVNDSDTTTASGNVITGENGGPGAADDLSQDTDNKVTFVNGQPVSATGDTTIIGTYGNLEIDADGNYTYTLNEAPKAETIYCFSKTNPSGSENAGNIDQVDMEYNQTTGQFTFTLQVDETADGFTVAVNNGPNPKGHGGELALVYFDATGSSPVVTAYAYNGMNTQTSYLDGGQALGIQPADQILSSLNNPESFSNISVTTDGAGNKIMTFTVDANVLNAHDPEYGPDGDWTGLAFDESVGIWLHPVSGLETEYGTDGFLTNWDPEAQSWYDTSNQKAEVKHVCPEPVTEEFEYTLTDEDGDSDNATLTINIDIDNDNKPVLSSDLKIIDETDLGAAFVMATGTITVDYGIDSGDGNGVIGSDKFFAFGSLKDGVLSHDGDKIKVELIDNVYVGKTETTDIEVFTLSIDANGDYKFTLKEALDHEDGTNPNDIIKLKFGVEATDYDCDTGEGYITIKVKDDAPKAVDVAGSVYESTLRDGGVITVTKRIPGVDFGEDGAGSVEASRFVAKFEFGGPDVDVTSGGEIVDVQIVGNGFVGKVGDKEIFTVELDPTNGLHTYTQYEPIDHPKDIADDVLWLKFYYNVIDDDGDSVEVFTTFDAIDDVPEAEDDVNSVDDSGEASGNVVAGTNGGPASKDTLSSDVANKVVKVAGQDLPTDGTSVNINGLYGVLTINNEGEYSYEAYEQNDGFKEFCLDPEACDVEGIQESLTKDGITVAVKNSGNFDITWLDTAEGSGLGINNLNTNDSLKVWPKGETFDVSFEEDVSTVTFAIAEIGDNNDDGNHGVDYTIYFEDGSTMYGEQAFVPGQILDGTITFTLDSAELGGKLISSVDLYSINPQSGTAKGGEKLGASFLLNNVKATVDEPAALLEKFEYTLQDFDGDESVATLVITGEGENLNIQVLNNGGNEVLHADNSKTDIFLFTGNAGNDNEINDFDLGDDVLDLSTLIETYDSASDAIADFISVTSDGDDTIISVDADGAANGASFENVVTIKDATGLDLENLVTEGTLVA